MLSFQILRTRLSVRFLSPFPVSLPQLFHWCFPFALAFGLFPFLPLSFVRFRSGSGYSAFCFFLSSSSLLRLSAAFQVPPLCLSTSLLSPVLSDLVSYVFFPGSSYSAFCSFPFILPSFAPTAVPLVLPFRFRLRAFPFPFCFLSSASVPVLTTQPLFLLFLFLPAFPSQWFLRCSSSAFAS